MLPKPLFVFLLTVLLFLAFNQAAVAQTDKFPKITKSGLSVQIEDFVQVPASSGAPPLARINLLYHSKDNTGRLFVNDLNGKLYVIDKGKITTYLDLASSHSKFTKSGGLGMGFYSFAFHPDFSTNGRFYTAHSELEANDPPDMRSTVSKSQPFHNVVKEWTAVVPSDNEFRGTSREILRTAQSTGAHSIQEIGFNPNAKPGNPDFGMLYIAHGDGGERDTDDPQNLSSPHGSLLRINPLGMNSRNGAYGIPSDNPFANDGDPRTLDEIWAYGFRNPHRFSWDTGGDGKLLIGNIGQAKVEEVELGKVGANYGWNKREGTFVFDKDNGGKISPLPPNDNTFAFTYPVAQYDHTEGQAIVGGFVYRGNQISELVGKYIFGDIVNGRIFYVNVDDLVEGKQSDITELILRDANGSETTMLKLVSAQLASSNRKAVDLRFGIDQQGEIYVLSKQDGKIRRLVPPKGNQNLLRGHWAFDEGEGVVAVDSSGQGNKGTVIGASWTNGNISNALAFNDVTDYVRVGTNGWAATQGTVALWAWFDGFPARKGFVFGHTTQPQFANRIQLYHDARGQLTLGLGDQPIRRANIKALATRGWTHIALTWDGTNYSVYVDGSEEADGKYSGLSTLNAFADIGNNGGTLEARIEALQGRIDDVRVYGRPLSAQEVQALIEESKNPTPPKFSLQVTQFGSGSGIVTISPGGVKCESECAALYDSGTSVTLTAAANPDSTFAAWGGVSCGSAEICTVTLTNNTIVTANFNKKSDPIPAVFYKPHIKPLFDTHCIECHGVNGSEKGISFENYASATQGNNAFRAVARINDPDNFMPPIPRGPLSKTNRDLFTAWQAGGFKESASQTGAANLGDLNGDGKADLIWRHTNNGSTAIWLMNGTTMTASGFPGGVPLAWQISGIGDVDADGKADVIWRNTTNGAVAVWLMNGITVTSTGFPGNAPVDWEIAGVGDVDGNGTADLVWRNTLTGQTAIWLMNGATRAASVFLGGVPAVWHIAGVGDVTGDGKADVIWRNSATGTVAVWLMNGVNITSVAFPANAPTVFTVVAVDDVDGDAKADLVWRNRSDGSTVIWLMNGGSINSSGSPGGMALEWVIAGMGDMTGDGKAEIVWRNTRTGALTEWVMDGIQVTASGSPSSVPTEWEIQ